MKKRYPSCFCFHFLRFFNRPIPVLFIVLLLFFSSLTQAQNSAAEKEAQQRLEKTATEYFEQQDLVNAYSLYGQLLSIYPHNPNYNYRLGACMLYASGDKKKAIKYIQYALKQTNVDNLAYYYMGRALHLNYEFDKAIQYYQKFEGLASSGELKKYPVKRLIEMCQNGKELITTSQELDVLRKKELNFAIFHEAYTMRSNRGTLISEPEEFKSKVDKKNKVVNLMYLTPDKKEAFFSSYGDNEDNGKDIYAIRKKADGTWGTAENLGNIINTPFDEDYPVYDAPRNTLYFASKGHNSMGGYDIFSSVYNDSTQTWSEPYNLDFPINTPDDDILLVPDTSGQLAFFASMRSSPQGKINVYKIALHLHPQGTEVVAGIVHKAGSEASEFSIITVRDSATNKIIATDTTSAQDGNYSFNLPKGGKYIFTVQDSTHKSQLKAVFLANAEGTSAVQQNIQFDAAGGLQIKNNMADASKSSDSGLAVQYIQNEAKMDVNVDTNSIQTLLAQKRLANANTLTASSITRNSQKPASTLPNAPSPSSDSLSNNITNDSKATDNSNQQVVNNTNDAVKLSSVSSVNKGHKTDTITSNADANTNDNSDKQVATNKVNVVKLPSVKEQKTDTIENNADDSKLDDNPTKQVANNNADGSRLPSVSKEQTTDTIANNAKTKDKSTKQVDSNTGVSASSANKTLTTNIGDTNVDNTTTNDNSIKTIANNSNGVASATSTNNEQKAGTVTSEVDNATKPVANNNTSAEKPSSVTKHQQNDSGSSNSIDVNTNSIVVAKGDAGNVKMGSADSAKAVQLTQDQQQLNDQAAQAIDYASDKMEQARQLQKRADNISTNRRGKSDSVAILSNEAKLAEEKGMEAYQLAAEYKRGAATKQAEINKIEKPTLSNDNGVNSVANVSSGDLIRQQATQVKNDSVQLANTNIEDEKEVSELQQKSADFIVQAGQTNDAQQKVALLQQADDLSKSKQEKQNDINDNNEQLKQLHTKYVWLTDQAKQADNISIAASNNNATNSNAAFQVAIEKEIDVYAKNHGADSITNITLSNANEENPIATNDNTSPTDRADTTNVVTQSRHSHHSKKNKKQSEETGNAVASNSPASDVNASGNDTQKAALNQDSENISSATNNSDKSQDVQTSSTTPSAVRDSSVATNTAAERINEVNGVSNNSPLNNRPDSSVYYKAPDNILLDSLAGAAPFMSNSTARENESNNEQNASSISDIKYTDATIAGLSQKSQNYFTAASQLTDTIKNIRSEARSEQDKNVAAALYRKADSVDALVYQLNLKGNEIITKADSQQYSANAESIKKDNIESPSVQSDKISIAQLKLKDAEDGYKKFLWERDSAVNTSTPALKESYMESAKKDLALAVLKQQRALYLYFQADSSQNSASSAVQDSDNNEKVASGSENKTVSQSDTVNADNSNNSQSNTQQKSIAAADNNEPAKEESHQDDRNVQQSNSDKLNASEEETKSSPKRTNEQPIADNTVSDNATPAKENSSENNSSTPKSSEKETANSVPVATNNAESTVSNGNGIVFKDANTPANSAPATEKHVNKPIPVDQPVAAGLIFGVQVGAFRNPIPPGLFSSFEPVVGMKTPEGLVRYIAGTFKTFDPAKDAAKKIRGMGYQGAFVVAFYNGKRISIKEALAMLGVSPDASSVETQPVAATEKPQANTGPEAEKSSQPAAEPDISGNNNAIAVSGNTTTPSKKELIDTKRKDSRAIKDSVPPAANAISDIKGLVYTVQVGSFSKRKGYSRLRKIKHLYYWDDVDGTVKYNSGIYSNFADAKAAKDIIVANTSVKDAFVTAYYQGKRITSGQAAGLLSSGVLPDKSIGNTQKATEASDQPAENIQPVSEETGSGPFVAASQTKVIYTVRIASFRGKLPVDTVNKLLSYASEGIEPHDEGQGITTYYSRIFIHYVAAQALQREFIKGGFPEAIVEAFYQGKKISVEEALTIKNQ